MSTFNIQRFPAFHRRFPRGQDASAVVRMKRAGDRLAFQFLKCRAEIFQDLAVGKLELAVGQHERDEGRKAIDDPPKFVLCYRWFSQDARHTVNDILRGWKTSIRLWYW